MASSGTPVPRAGWDLQPFEYLPIGTRTRIELHADRHEPPAGVELGQRRTDVADRCDADRFGQALGRDAEPPGDVAARMDKQLGPVERRRQERHC